MEFFRAIVSLKWVRKKSIHFHSEKLKMQSHYRRKRDFLGKALLYEKKCNLNKSLAV